MKHSALMQRWTELGDKLYALAMALPEARFDARPRAEVRSPAELLRHVAFWNEYAAKTLRHEPADGEANELPASRFRTKAEIVPALQESFGAVARQLAATNGRLSAADEDTVVSFIQHGAEHYGQLVVYARLDGIVPPASRAG